MRNVSMNTSQASGLGMTRGQVRDLKCCEEGRFRRHILLHFESMPCCKRQCRVHIQTTLVHPDGAS